MLVLLPPSEGKAEAPKRGRTLDLDALSFPGLTATRSAVLQALVDLASGPRSAALGSLGLTAGQSSEVDRDLVIFGSADSPRRASLHRRSLPVPGPCVAEPCGATTSTLPGGGGECRLRRGAAGRSAADVPSLDLGAAARAAVARRAVAPRARLRPARGGRQAEGWCSTCDPGRTPPRGALSGPCTDAPSRVRVLQEARPGDPSSRSIVSHANKSTKGSVLRALLEDGSEPTSATGADRAACRSGFPG